MSYVAKQQGWVGRQFNRKEELIGSQLARASISPIL